MHYKITYMYSFHVFVHGVGYLNCFIFIFLYIIALKFGLVIRSIVATRFCHCRILTQTVFRYVCRLHVWRSMRYVLSIIRACLTTSRALVSIMCNFFIHNLINMVWKWFVTTIMKRLSRIQANLMPLWHFYGDFLSF